MLKGKKVRVILKKEQKNAFTGTFHLTPEI